MKRKRELIRTDLRGGIRRLTLQRMFLGNRHKPGGSIHLTRRGVNDARHVQLSRRLQHVKRALYIRIYVSVGRMVRVRYGNQRSEMEYRVAAAHCGLHTMGIS